MNSASTSDEHGQETGRGRTRVSFALRLCIVAVFLVAGGALIDVGRVMAAREGLDRLAVRAAERALVEQPVSLREGNCRKVFAETLWTDVDVSLDELSVSVDVAGQHHVATVEYDATVRLTVGRFFGVPAIEISGDGEAGRSLPASAPEEPAFDVADATSGHR